MPVPFFLFSIDITALRFSIDLMFREQFGTTTVLALALASATMGERQPPSLDPTTFDIIIKGGEQTQKEEGDAALER